MNTCRKEVKIFRVISIILLVSLLAACGPKPEVSAPAAPAEPESAPVVEAPPAEPAPPAAPAVVEPAAELPPAEPAVPEMIMAGEPLNTDRTLEDADGSLRASEKRALSGDAILDNRYERPFSQTDMIYLPDVDIQTVKVEYDDVFFYFTLKMKGVDFGTGKFTAAYGIEFDRNLDGRGDLLVWASDPQPEWSSENLIVYADKNGNVGGLKPMVAEAGMESDGYETSVELGGDLAAYARINPRDPSAVQIAVSRALLNNAEDFLWGAWADKVVKNPSRFDYNDAFGPGEAGSPIKPSKDYPLKALHSLDNTCRLPFGLITSTGIPGMCKSVPKVEKDKSCYCVEWASTAHICIRTSCD
jgi:hypothetical protein